MSQSHSDCTLNIVTQDRPDSKDLTRIFRDKYIGALFKLILNKLLKLFYVQAERAFLDTTMYKDFFFQFC